MMKKLTCSFLALTIISFFASALVRAEDVTKIGFVNAQRIIEESKAGIDAYQKLKQLQDKHKELVEIKKAGIEKAEEEYLKQYMTLSETAKNEKEEQLRNDRKDFKRMLEDADSEIAQKEKQYMEKIQKEVMDIIQQLGKEEGYTLILDKVTVLYASQAIDLTDKVILKYDQTFQP
ncbi:OmpH family outer membrane protein [bacterium]|nr:OmpH family outer membrane protein [candidate division CSSED10-310 bacterium]